MEFGKLFSFFLFLTCLNVITNASLVLLSSNDECLADADAPYTLSYAVIMLNTDQHNKNASKQNVPMTSDQVIWALLNGFF